MNGILASIGNTPLVELQRVFRHSSFRLFAKIEALNPGGSIKDRPAIEVLRAGIRAGEITPDTVVVESSSGNMGVGLAQACRYHGLRFICVVDPRASEQNLKLIRAYGAEIDYVSEPDPATGEFLQARLARVGELVDSLGAYWPDQYSNRHNPLAHYVHTMREILDQLPEPPDYVFMATSTCGTIRGCSELLRDEGLSTKVIAVDAEGSQIFGSIPRERLIPGMGAGLKPKLCELSLIHDCVHVDDMDCVVGCRQLVDKEAILAGGSSGGVVSAVRRYAVQIAPGSVCAAILPDRGERYLDTVYSDEWVEHAIGPMAESMEAWDSPPTATVRDAIPVQARR